MAKVCLREKKKFPKIQAPVARNPAFKDWLVRPSAGESSVTCKACQRSVSSSKTSLIRHTETAMHKRAVQSNRMDGRQRHGNLVQCLRRQEEQARSRP
jgi:hypothetical protein